jgi:methionyl-tRNA formyltransferase
MRILMMGTGPFAVPTFQHLLHSQHTLLGLVTRPVPPAKGRRKAPANPMRDLAESHDLPIFAPQDVNAPESITELSRQQADLLVVCDFGQILSRDALATAPRGGINLHASLLPKYRGAAPINWALYHGESETGVTVIHMTARLDGGPCLVRKRTESQPEDDAVSLEQRLAEIGVSAVAEAMTLLESWNGTDAIGDMQDPEQATRAPRLKKTDGLVDWQRSARQICDQVRALKPWPGTFSTWQDGHGRSVRLILDRVSAVPAEHVGVDPGHVALVDKRQVLVATGDGLLSLDVVQPAGKRTMEIGEFLRGHAVAPGQRLGDDGE